MPFIKSHSNYVLKSKHQDVNDGTIFERDITTIGAVDQFSPGQTPIYRSNNFIITVRNDGRPANQYNTSKWKENDSGDIWTLQTIDNMVSDFEDDNDTKIVLKQDYYDFRDFAYYGSLTELFRVSVGDILARFPGELYITSDYAYYTVRESYDFEKIETKYPIGGYGKKTDEDGNLLPKYSVISNPFNINLYVDNVPDGADPLKYFAENGFLNYQIGKPKTTTTKLKCGENIEDYLEWCDITGWTVTYHDPCSKIPDFCNCSDLEIETWTPSKCECDNLQATLLTSNNRATRNLLKASSNEASDDESEESEEYYRRIATITISYTCEDGTSGEIIIYAYLDDYNNVVYMVDNEDEQQGDLTGMHIRPRKADKPHYFLDVFYSDSDNFQKLLVNEDTHYKATFSVIRENAYGYYREFVSLQFPTGAGGYNLDATNYGFNEYTNQMVEIGEYYDENFTDNLWRSMTHEAIKNFDWTYTREYETGEEEEYVLGGQRIQKALRVFAREFDEIISYINNIKTLNRVTYDERGNIPNYFLTDVVENEGWDVKLVYPYTLTEYFYVEEYYFENTKYDTKEDAIVVAKDKYKQEQGETDKEYNARIEGLIRTVVTDEKQICEDSGDTKWAEGGDTCDGQLNNMACGKKITRDFSQNSTNKVKPYTQWMIGDGSENGYFIVCKGDNCTSIATVTADSPIIDKCADGETEVTVNWKKTGGEDSRIEIPTPCEYSDMNYVFVNSDCDSTLLDNCALGGQGSLKNKIKTYTDETEWSYQQVNNEFLKRLKINSRYIWRHKGTVEGIEMILAMFGMKSKRWVEAHPEWEIKCKYTDCDGSEEEGTECHEMWDYDIQEYSSFTSRLEETWDVIHQNYRINWINSTKTITYDNRFISNYNQYGANQDALPYQGIPLAYREAYVSEEGEDAYLGYSAGTPVQKINYLDEKNEKIIKRYLYPNFNKEEEFDGDPYFQMRGGWLSKMIVGDTRKPATEGEEGETPIWNFQFNTDDEIVFNKYLAKGYEESGFTHDNTPLYKETIRNIRRVDGIGKLLSIPTIELYNGIICYVTQIEKNSAIIDNVIYPISIEWYNDETKPQDSGHTVSSVTFVKTEGFVKVGNSKFFDTTIWLYDIDGEERVYDIEAMEDGSKLKAYIKDGGFICKEDENGYYSISDFQILTNETDSNNFTNYYLLDDINYADTLAKIEYDETTSATSWTNGWRRLFRVDKEYLKISTITNYYEGNNPHNGKMIYDNGHEYFTYFNRIFKHAADNELFDERCYEDFYEALDDEITHYGFSGLIENNEDILQYDDFLVPDTKIHYFGNYKTKSGDAKSYGVPNIDKVYIYGDNTYRLSGETEGQGGYDKIYFVETDKVEMYNLSANTISTEEDVKKGWIEEENPYNALTAKTDTIVTHTYTYNEKTQDYDDVKETKTVKRYPVMDEVTKQVVNNKIFDITFRLHLTFDEEGNPLSWYSKRVQEELKYIDDIVMNYLTQMIPSTTILRIKYQMSDVIPTVVINGNASTEEDTNDTNNRGNEEETITKTYTLNVTPNCTTSQRNIGKITDSDLGASVNVIQEAGKCSTCPGKCDCNNLNAKKL